MKAIFFLFIAVSLLISGCIHEKKESFAYGNFESEEITVSAEVSGLVMEFQITEGMNIEKGVITGFVDTMQLSLKRKQLGVGLRSAKGRINQLDEQLKVNGINLKNLLREKDRIEALLRDGAATSKQLDDISGQIDLIHAQTGVLISQKITAQTEIESVLIQIDQVNDQLSRSYIKSPINGIILEKFINAGELVVAGKALFKVSDLEI